MIWFFDSERKRRALRDAREVALRQALIGYSLYDPPHKVEERRLSRVHARENFDYFMSVRPWRLAGFREWMEVKFGVRLTLDRNGVVALCDWCDLYGELLFASMEDLDSYFYYSKPWTDECIGSNVVFDMGAFVGEALIAQCPKLYWDEYPFSALEEKDVRKLKEHRGTGFQRPEITGFRNPLTHWDVFQQTGGYFMSLFMLGPSNKTGKQNRVTPKRRWVAIVYSLVGHFHRNVDLYSDRWLPPGVAPRDGYDVQ